MHSKEESLTGASIAKQPLRVKVGNTIPIHMN